MAGIILNGSVIKGLILNGSPVSAIMNGVKVFPTEEPAPSTTILYHNNNTIVDTYAQSNEIPWNDYNFILIQRSWQYSGSDGVCAIDNADGNWKFHIRKFNSYLPSDKFGIEAGGWGYNCTIDDSSVTTTYFWSTNWYVIPINPANYLTDKIIIQPSTNTLYYYANGTLMIHRTDFSDFISSIRFRSTGVNIKDMYVVGCNTLEDAVNF